MTYDVAMNELSHLIKKGNDENFFDKLEYHIITGFNINQKDEYGNTLLHIACRCRNYSIVEKIIDDYNANILIKNSDGRIPLHIAVIYGSQDVSSFIPFDGGIRKNIGNSKKIISKLIKENRNTLLIEDDDKIDPIGYFLIHSKPMMNEQIVKNIQNYRIKKNFFESLKKNYSDDYQEYNLSRDIFFSLKIPEFKVE
jgi:hypothetical protein